MGYKIQGDRKRKPGGGRKPKAATVAKQRLIENKIDEAEASFAFMVAVRDNEQEPTQQRTAAATWIYESVFGKAKQPTEQSGELTVKVVYVKRSNGATNGDAPSTGNDTPERQTV